MIFFPFRYSLNIEKQILWILLAFFLSKKKYESVLDIGCGRGDNLRMIRFKKYLGLDIDKKRIYKNSNKYKNPSINFITGDITNKNHINSNYSLVLLIQVFTNSFFDDTKIMQALSNTILSSNKYVIFNTSFKNKNNLFEIEKILLENNFKFKKIRYGINPYLRKIRIPILTQLFSLIFLLVILNKSNTILSDDKVLYICQIK